jgi:hypothetical protein
MRTNPTLILAMASVFSVAFGPSCSATSGPAPGAGGARNTGQPLDDGGPSVDASQALDGTASNDSGACGQPSVCGGGAQPDSGVGHDSGPTGPGIYIAQASVGAGDGSSCANARAYTFFNSATNWGSGSNQIGPGTVVRLCGTITSDLIFQASGSAADPIVLDGTGATLGAHLIIGALSYWTVQNVTWSTSFPTDGSVPLDIKGGSFATINGNTLDVYSPSPTIFLQQTDNATALAHDIVISNNFLRTSATNTDAQTDLLDTEGSYNITVEGNYFEMRSQNNAQHDDCLQTWQKGGASAGPPYNWTIRYNEFVMNTTSTNNKSWHMIEEMGAGYVNIYGNVYVGLQGASAANGIVFDSNQSSMVANIYGNTIVEKTGANNNLFNLAAPGTINLSDNIIYSTDAGNALTGGGPVTRDHNLWFGANVPSCVSTEICGKTPMFNNYDANDFSLESGSPAVGAGANQGATYNAYPLSSSTWPNPSVGTRPAAGAWNIGAYN